MWKKITVNIAEELIRRSQDDQKLRKRWIDSGNADSFTKQVMKMDADNTAWLKDYVNKKGFPGKSNVGEEAVSAAWLLTQHADPDFQEHALGLINAAPAGEHNPADIAYLTDRVQMHRGEPQTYGTQFKEEDGKTQHYPMIDPKNVDERRQSVGLGPLKDYLREFGL